VDAFSLSFVALHCLGFSVLAFRLVRLSLASTFRWFFVLCIFEPVRMGIAAAFPRDTDAYGYYYFITQPLVWILYVLITLEVFQGAFAEFPGIYSLSRKALTGSVVVAAVIAVATVGIDFSKPDGPYQFLEVFLLLERTVVLSLVVFVLALTLLLSWFPVQLNRNALTHVIIFSLFFAAKAAMLFSRNLFGVSFTRAGNIGLLCAVVICLCLWLVFLVENKESRLVRSGVPHDPAKEARLMQQLNALNETLAGSLRK